jgi:hypothetical protein
MRIVVLVVALIAACTCPPPESPQPAPAPPAEPPPGPTPPAEPTTPALPAQAEKCDPAQGCAGGLTCVSYYGIAGPGGPQFHSCEIPCGEGSPACPEGQQCTTIADGPGQVCRPIERPEPPASPDA